METKERKVCRDIISYGIDLIREKLIYDVLDLIRVNKIYSSLDLLSIKDEHSHQLLLDPPIVLLIC
jgi:hypothetical protein